MYCASVVPYFNFTNDEQNAQKKCAKSKIEVTISQIFFTNNLKIDSFEK